MLRELPQVFERGARAIGRPPQVDALGAEALSDRVEVAHRDPRGVLAGVAAQRTQTALQVIEVLLRVEPAGERGVAVGAVERDGNVRCRADR